MANEFIARKGIISLDGAQVTGSLSVTGNISASIFTGSFRGDGSQLTGVAGAATASYVEYANVANKPALVSGSSQISFNGIVDKPTLVSGSSQVTYSGLSGIPAGIVSGSSQVSFNGIVDKPTLVSGSSQVTYGELSGIPVGIVSSSTQITGYNIFATTGSNQFNGSQAITGSLTVTGQVVAQTLNVQQVTSSIVFSSGSNIFGNSLSNTQQFTGSVSVTGSLISTSGLQITANNNALGTNNTLRFTDTDTATEANQQIGKIEFFSSDTSTPGAGVKAYIGAFAQDSTPDAYIAFATQDGSGTPDPVERLRISSEGNVGISTNSPYSKLDVAGSISLNGRPVIDNNTTELYFGGITGISGRGTDLIAFYTSNTEKMRLTSTGNLGLGVTPSASWYTGYTAMQIGESAALFSNRTSADTRTTQLANNAFLNSNASNWIYQQSDEATRYGQVGGEHQWLTAPSGTAGNAITFTQAMTLDASGNLLIGATSNVSSGRRELVMRGANGSVVSLGNNTTADRFQIASDSGENALLNNKANTPMIFYTNNAEVMRILSGGVACFQNTVCSPTFIGQCIGIRNTSLSYLTIGNYGSAGNYIDVSGLPTSPSNYMITLAPPSTFSYYGGGIAWSEGTCVAAGINVYDDGAAGALGLSLSTGNNSCLAERFKINSVGAACFACELTAKSLGTNDLILNNLNHDYANYVDGTRGSWLIQEGACDLFIINQVSCKKYKFNLIEIN